MIQQSSVYNVVQILVELNAKRDKELFPRELRGLSLLNKTIIFLK